MDTTEAYVKYIFNLAGIGMPYRVDFTPCGKVSGFKEETRQPNYKSAFVHFHLFYDGADSIISFEGLDAGMFQTIETEPYWRILKNRNPVSTTMMNVHQIVANCCALEEKVAQLERDRDYHLDTFKFMSNHISILEKTIYRLSDFVFDKVTPRLSEEDEDLSGKIECENLDSASVSTHSSMPSLESPTPEEVCWDDSEGPTRLEIASAYDIDDSSVEEDGDSSDPTIQWLNQAIQVVEARLKVVRENSTMERIRSSAYLCGNE